MDDKLTPRQRERARLIREAHRMKAEIIQLFRDTAYYNKHVLPPGREPVEADPDGEMKHWLEFHNRTIMGENFAD